MVEGKLPANRYELRMLGADTKIFSSADKVAAAFHAADVDKSPSVHRFVRGQPEAVVARTAARIAPEYTSATLERILKRKAVDPVPPEGERFRDAYYAVVDASLRMRLEAVEDWAKVQPRTADGVWKLDRATYDDLEALAFARPERAMQAWMDHVGTRFDAPTLVDYETGQVATLADTVNLKAARNLHEYRFGIGLNAQQAPQQLKPEEVQPAAAQPGSERAQSPGKDPSASFEQTTAGAPRVQVGTDPDSYTNHNAQQERDTADRRGLTGEIEGLFARGLTVQEVVNTLASKLDFAGDRQDQKLFITQVRATLGIPSRMTTEGQEEFKAWKAGYDKRQLSPSVNDTPPQQEGSTMNMTRLQIDGVDVGRLAFEKHSTEAGVFVDLTALDRSDKPVAQFTGVDKADLDNILGPTVGHEVAKFNGGKGEFKGEQLDIPAAEVAKAVKAAPARQGQEITADQRPAPQQTQTGTAKARAPKKDQPAAEQRQGATTAPSAQPAPAPANSVEPANGLAYAIDGTAVESVKFSRRGQGTDQVVDLRGFNGKEPIIEAKGVPLAELGRVVGEAAAQHIAGAKGRTGTLKGEAAPEVVEAPALAATAAARAGKAAPQQTPAAVRQPKPAAPVGTDAPAAGPGDTVTLQVLRRGQRETISLHTGSSRELGLTMRPLQGDEARAAGVADGLLVGGVSGAAHRAGVLPGDVLVAVNGTSVSSINQVRAAAAKAKPAPAPSSTPAQQASVPSSIAAQKPAPAVEEPPAVKARRVAQQAAIEALKASLAERFIVRAGHAADSTEYRFRGEPGVLAFVDRGSKLATDRNEADVARGIVDLAQAKGWKALALAGTEDFRRNVWREAAARGLPASGYTPTKADQEWVAARQGVQQANTVARAETQQPAQRPAQPAAVASVAGDIPRQGATKEQVMNAMRAGLRDLNMDKASSDRIMERLSVRLDGLLAQGKPLPNIARYDRAAMSKMPEFAARQAQQQGQARARAR